MDFQPTAWERLTISGLVGRLQALVPFGGDAALIHKAIKVFDAIDLTDEEKAEINLRQLGNSLAWDDPAHKWDASIKDKEAAALVLRVVRENVAWPASKAREVAALHEALGLDWPPADGEAGE